MFDFGINMVNLHQNIKWIETNVNNFFCNTNVQEITNLTSNLKKTKLYPIWGIISQLGNNIPLGELLTSAILSSGCPSFDLLDWLLSFSKPSNSSSSIKCSNSSSSVYNVKNIPMGEFSHRMLYQLFKYTPIKFWGWNKSTQQKLFQPKSKKYLMFSFSVTTILHQILLLEIILLLFWKEELLNI